MEAPSAGSIVLLPFPFSDLSQSKIRPAMVLADAGRGDWILCQITSKPYSDNRAVQITELDFAEGGLQLSSYVRPAKLFTANNAIFLSIAGRLNDSSRKRILTIVREIFPF